MRVLYVDHTSRVSGAQRALLDLVNGLPSGVVPIVMCPEGQLAQLVRASGADVLEFRGTSGSLRLHPAHTPRAAGEILRSAVALRRAVAVHKADVIHANSIRAGLIAGAARRAGATPTVAHIHDALPHSRSANLVRRAIHASADIVVTISKYTEENFAHLRGSRGMRVLYNPLDTSTFSPAVRTKAEARDALGIAQDSKLVGVVAQITPWKGQDTAIRTLALLRDRHPDARLLLIGEPKFVDKATRYDNVSFERWLRQLATVLGVADRVEFCGEREDAATIMRALDVLLAPSWEEPFGRSVIEAMALETPVIATDVGGPPEYIEHGVDGVLVSPHDVERWAVAVDRLLRDDTLGRQLAERGSAKVRRLFDRREYVSRMLEVYDEVTAGPRRSKTRRSSSDLGTDLGEPVLP